MKPPLPPPRNIRPDFALQHGEMLASADSIRRAAWTRQQQQQRWEWQRRQQQRSPPRNGRPAGHGHGTHAASRTAHAAWEPVVMDGGGAPNGQRQGPGGARGKRGALSVDTHPNQSEAAAATAAANGTLQTSRQQRTSDTAGGAGPPPGSAHGPTEPLLQGQAGNAQAVAAAMQTQALEAARAAGDKELVRVLEGQAEMLQKLADQRAAQKAAAHKAAERRRSALEREIAEAIQAKAYRRAATLQDQLDGLGGGTGGGSRVGHPDERPEVTGPDQPRGAAQGGAQGAAKGLSEACG